MKSVNSSLVVMSRDNLAWFLHHISTFIQHMFCNVWIFLQCSIYAAGQILLTNSQTSSCALNKMYPVNHDSLSTNQQHFSWMKWSHLLTFKHSQAVTMMCGMNFMTGPQQICSSRQNFTWDTDANCLPHNYDILNISCWSHVKVIAQVVGEWRLLAPVAQWPLNQFSWNLAWMTTDYVCGRHVKINDHTNLGQWSLSPVWKKL